MLLLSGCGNSDNTPSVSPPASPSASTQTQTETLIGSYYTKILDTNPERVNNLTVCANALNGETIAPGMIFSFNDSVGQRTESKGYEEARILIGDEAGCAVGGGVCQVSSTIYNAANGAGMQIVERHNHQNEVHYVKIGNDAAVSYGALDFKFKNISDKTVKLDVSVGNGYVYAKLYSIAN